MGMLKHFAASFLFLVFFLMSGAVFAAEPQKIGDFGDWSSYFLVEGNGKVCYMVSKPASAKGKYKKRGDVFTLIAKGESSLSYFCRYCPNNGTIARNKNAKTNKSSA